MDFQRVLAFTALALVLLLLWQAWQKDYGPQPATSPAAEETTGAARDLPPEAAPQGSAPQAPDAAPVATLASGRRITAETDLLRLTIDTRGGDLRRVELLDYPEEAEQPDEPFVLLDDVPGRRFYVAQSGLRSAAGSELPAPDHHTEFQVSREQFRLQEGEEQLEVRLTWRSAEGVEVAKVYTLHRDRYVIDLHYEVTNQGSQPWRGHLYGQLQRSRPVDGRSAFGIYTYTGGVIYSEEEKYEKISFDDMEKRPLNRTIEGGWAAMIEHYFLSAWIPDPEASHLYYSKALDEGRYLLGMVGPAAEVAPGEKAQLATRLFVGPKLQHRLEALAPGLELTVDYGILTVISKPLFWLLEKIHALVGNWGWSIVLLTVLIKLAFFKLSATSYKSMAHMRKVQPRLKAIKERFGDDRQKLNEAMMRLYKEEKINPLGGCLPILVQIPVFIALYWVLLESVELRQAPFMLWITDLSSKDPYFVLPILMGVSMLLQHRLNPTPMDPIQAKVMMILPIVFTVFFAFFPAGLVLYWVVNNVLSIAQQWYITHKVVQA